MPNEGAMPDAIVYRLPGPVDAARSLSNGRWDCAALYANPTQYVMDDDGERTDLGALFVDPSTPQWDAMGNSEFVAL